MGVSVCLPLPNRGEFQNQWDYILSSFPVDRIYVIGDKEDAPTTNVFGDAKYIDTAADLPKTPTLVALSPEHGEPYPGTAPLADFTHPSNVIYMFGPDNYRLTDEYLGGRTPNHLVYIPTATKDDLYSWVAYAVVRWDRSMKDG